MRYYMSPSQDDKRRPRGRVVATFEAAPNRSCAMLFEILVDSTRRYRTIGAQEYHPLKKSPNCLDIGERQGLQTARVFFARGIRVGGHILAGPLPARIEWI